MKWPTWWHWDLELTPHLERRMEDRDFTEVDLRHMLETAKSLDPDWVEGRWVVGTRHHGQQWEVVVEPDFDEELMVVVTAYAVES